jgi:hypothetical protein
MREPIGVRTHGIHEWVHHRCTRSQFSTAADLDRRRCVCEWIENIHRVAFERFRLGKVKPCADQIAVRSPVSGMVFFLRRPLSHPYRVGCAEPG